MPADTFTPLVDAHYGALYRFALSLARREAEACDLVQQTFYLWATKGDNLREASRAKTWLFTTLYREFLRNHRRGQRMQAIEDLPPGQQDAPEENLPDLNRLDGALVLAALQDVDEAFRAPLTLFYLEDLSYRDIALTLDIPIGTVMSRLARGKGQLRTRLAARLTRADSAVIDFPNSQQRGAQ